MAEDEVVLRRVERVDPTQGLAHFLDGRPRARAATREPEVVGDPVNVLVQRDPKLSGRYAVPDPEVRVPVADHPADEQGETLARTARGVTRAREEGSIPPRGRTEGRTDRLPSKDAGKLVEPTGETTGGETVDE